VKLGLFHVADMLLANSFVKYLDCYVSCVGT
jgi:hypothetical protein